MTCDDCGTDVDVYETVCPFDLEILGVETTIHICAKCEDERAMEI